MIDSQEAQFAITAVREAARITRQVQRKMIAPGPSGPEKLVKEDRSPVTVADFAAQAIVAKRLQETFATAKLVGEEDSGDLQATPEGQATLERVQHFLASAGTEATAKQVCDWIDIGNAEATGEYWTLDPVDGTKGFLRGDQYVVALALIRDGQVQLGVLGCPGLVEASQSDTKGAGSLLIAARGQGTWTTSIDGNTSDWAQLCVADTNDIKRTRIFRSVETAHTNTGQLGQLASAMGVEAEPIPMDSQAKYAVLAAGGGDMLVRLLSASRLDYRECIWDQAAGSIVVEEAGGRVTDLDGKPLDFSHGKKLTANRGVLATNGRVHEAALAALQQIGA